MRSALFLTVHFTSSWLTTHDLEQILPTHTALNTWPPTQQAVPHTSSHRLLKRDINSEKQVRKKRNKEESIVHVPPSNSSSIQSEIFPHYGNYDSDYLPKIVLFFVFSIHMCQVSMHITFYRCSESDHKLVLGPKKSPCKRDESFFLSSHSCSVFVNHLPNSIHRAATSLLSAVWQRSNKLWYKWTEREGVKSNYNLHLIPSCSKSQSLSSPPLHNVCLCVHGSLNQDIVNRDLVSFSVIRITCLINPISRSWISIQTEVKVWKMNLWKAPLLSKKGTKQVARVLWLARDGEWKWGETGRVSRGSDGGLVWISFYLFLTFSQRN